MADKIVIILAAAVEAEVLWPLVQIIQVVQAEQEVLVEDFQQLLLVTMVCLLLVNNFLVAVVVLETDNQVVHQEVLEEQVEEVKVHQVEKVL
jgi:hypothetical protein